MFDLKSYLAERQERVNQSLNQFLGKPVSGNEKIYEAVAYSLKAGGKRVRPILAIATAEALHVESEKILPFACALEMIHTYSLIHDDLPSMDDDDLRRGQPTNHRVFGIGCAILAGDALLTKAFELLSSSEHMKLEVVQEVARAAGIDGMVGGQLMDLDAEQKEISLDDLERIHRHKTGALLKCSVVGSAKLSNASANQLENLATYGSAIGIAFQIADDVLDIEGGQQIGKDVGSDLDNAKATYPKLLGLSESKDKAKQYIDQALQAVSSFDERATPLREIARYIVNRSY